ncbi:dTDP-4-dehydrorhamnose 3,5-epimerase [Winogradskyella poriferorum]|uniref:dTDP-4-dehydrorhamnose 3,5-epimerase n=1 Tax=Winogradskyella poriferorum TaxID=307627 RepID=UPI003D6539A5
MQVRKTNLEGCLIIEPTVFWDQRGYFLESYNDKAFKLETGLDIEFIQDNESQSSEGVLRGLHFQRGINAQAKLVRVVKGSVLDVVVDIRPHSKTFGHHFSIELSEENKLQVFIPKGFAHGFLTLEDNTIFSYKCDNYYNKDSESGIIFNDIDLSINWKIGEKQLVVSERDLSLPGFKNIQL